MARVACCASERTDPFVYHGQSNDRIVFVDFNCRRCDLHCVRLDGCVAMAVDADDGAGPAILATSTVCRTVDADLGSPRTENTRGIDAVLAKISNNEDASDECVSSEPETPLASAGVCAAALTMVSASHGRDVWIPSLWEKKRTVVCFLRHLGCRFCEFVPNCCCLSAAAVCVSFMKRLEVDLHAVLSRRLCVAPSEQAPRRQLCLGSRTSITCAYRHHHSLSHANDAVYM
jgi:hypothetical protein